MYSYEWDERTGGLVLNAALPKEGAYVASEIRPVYASELTLIGFNEYFAFDAKASNPICWAKHNVYIYRGREIAKLEKTQYGRPLTRTYLVPKQRLETVDVGAMLAHPQNVQIMRALVADTQKRLKEMYDHGAASCDLAYIAFSGGKDSMLLLDLCHRTLPLDVPVVFSDTDMELPSTYRMWEEVQKRYPGRTFLKAKASVPALQNWETFGPPSRTVRWCCSVHKSTPAILLLKERTGKDALRVQAFLGVRKDESLSRSTYDDMSEGTKNASQNNAYPILNWGSHELWLYTLAERLPVNAAYRKGLPRVGCVLCPESSEKYAWFVEAIFPGLTKPYNEVIFKTIDKKFATKQDRMDYLASAGWQARRSGETLKQKIYGLSEKTVDSTVAWTIAKDILSRVQEWMKTLGQVACEGQCWTISYRNGVGAREHSLTVDFEEIDTDSVRVKCRFADASELRSYGKFVRQCLYKAIACVGCFVCEAECRSGALHFVGGAVTVDVFRCVHCLKCHTATYGCWRCKSMYVSEGSTKESGLSSINKYNNFGLRQEWLAVFLQERENFALTSALGNKMVASGKAWMRQALLMQEKGCAALKLLDVVERFGVESQRVWDCLWIALANRAALVKWLVTATEVGWAYAPDDLLGLMGGVKDATKEGGLAALKDMLTKSPLGTGENAVVKVEKRGRRVAQMTRVPHPVDDLAMLYGLFVMARQAGQTSFSVSGQMAADMASPYVSPLVAFAMPVEAFKRQCQVLADRYGNFVHCAFTHGLDEVQVKTDEKTLDDVIDLMLHA